MFFILRVSGLLLECFAYWITDMIKKCWNTTVKGLYKAFEAKIKSKGYDYLDSGATRHVFQRKNYVIKIPLSGDGIIDNIVEATVWL